MQPADGSAASPNGLNMDWVVCWGSKLGAIVIPATYLTSRLATLNRRACDCKTTGKVGTALRLGDLRYLSLGVPPPASPAVSAAYAKLLGNKVQVQQWLFLLLLKLLPCSHSYSCSCPPASTIVSPVCCLLIMLLCLLTLLFLLP